MLFVEIGRKQDRMVGVADRVARGLCVGVAGRDARKD